MEGLIRPATLHDPPGCKNANLIYELRSYMVLTAN